MHYYWIIFNHQHNSNNNGWLFNFKIIQSGIASSCVIKYNRESESVTVQQSLDFAGMYLNKDFIERHDNIE